MKSLRKILPIIDVLADELRAMAQRAVAWDAVAVGPPAMVRQLEPRILLSASPASALAEDSSTGASTAQDADQLLMMASSDTVADADASSSQDNVTSDGPSELRREILFIDAGLADDQQLIDGLMDNGPDRWLSVVVIEDDHDGMEQIAVALAEYTDLDAIHFVSHGTLGAVKLGGTWLTADSLDAYAGHIARWAGSLNDRADLLFYGCDLAGNAEGQTLVESLAALTGADVAASTDHTGHAEFAGDWDLEFQTGRLEASIAVGQSVQDNWLDLLGVITVTTANDVLDGDTTSISALLGNAGADGFISLREAIIATNNTAGADTIFLPVGTFVLSRTGASENLAATGDLDITGDLTIAGAGANMTFIDGAAADRVFEILSGTVAMSGLTIQNGNSHSSDGGGVNIAGGATLTLQDTALSGNIGQSGGAIFVSGSLVLDRVTIEGNTAFSGAGIGLDNVGTAALTNVTMSGNAAASTGGAIYTKSSVSITSSTIVNNSAVSGAGGIDKQVSSSVTLQNTILAYNIGGNANCILTSLGNNIDSANTAGLTGPGDQINTNPLLGPLQYNGGTTKTLSLLDGSPAINAGTANGAPATDQRGASRFGATDIGAFEYTMIGYEPFAYATGSFNGANGGSGWAGGWSSVGTDTTIVASSLQNPTIAMPVSGGTSQLAMPVPSGVTQTRDLATTLGAAETTAWLSFLIKPDATTSADYVGLEFGSSSAAIAFAGYNGNAFVLQQSGGSGSVQVSGITPMAGQSYLLTVKLQFAAGIDTMTLYVNPTPGLAGPDSAFTATKSDVDLGTFTQLCLAGARGVDANNAALDEIRIAGSYLDAAPGSQIAPILNPAASPTLVAENEDSGVPAGAVGTLVSSLVDFPGGGGLDNVTDADSGALLGIAVTAADTTNGTWYYSIDAGTNWNVLGAVAGNNARLLAADTDTRLYFQPNANYHGTLATAITFRAWDRMSGSNGALADTTTNGGITAFSTATDTASLVINSVNDAPVIASNGGGITAAVNLAENATSVTTVTSIDIDGGAAVYSLVGGADQAKFTINASTGAFSFLSLPNFEAPGDADANNVYDVIVQVSDGTGGTDTQTISVTITDVDEFDVGPISDTNVTANAVNENSANGTAVGITANATDADGTNNTITYSLDDNAGGRFAVDSNTGVVTVAGTIDRETAASYTITARATSIDGSYTTQDFNIAINDLDEFDIGALTDSDAAANAVNEDALVGTEVGITAHATDADPTDTVTYSLDDDAGGLIVIDGTSGIVTVNGVLDYETVTSHNITVRASSADGSFSTQIFTISVNDINEAGVGPISDTDAGSNAVGENAAGGTVVGITAFADDPDAMDSVTYSLDDDAGGRFAIDGGTGVVTVAGSLDREMAASYDITVRATSTDSTSSTRDFTILLTDVDEFDVGSIGDTNPAANAVNENAAIGITVGLTALATDVDATTNTITYSLDDDAGGRFAINAATGVVTVAGAVDRETAASYGITVRATGADTSFSTQTFTIAINDVDEFDVDSIGDADPAANAVDETAAVGSSVGLTIFASDADATNNTITYSMDDDVGGRFAIHANTGVVTVAGGLDYETATSHAVIIRATGSDGTFLTQSFTIDLIDQNDSAPAIVANTLVLTKGETVTLTSGNLNSVDPDSTPTDLTYTVSSLTGGRFELGTDPGVAISSFTQHQVDFGQVTFVHDGHELPPTYRVTLSDGVQHDGPQLANVTFNDPNQAPQASSLSFEVTTSPLSASVMPAATDVDGDPLTIFLIATPAHGTIRLDPDGTFVYTPSDSFSGVDSFSYRAFDGQLLSNEAVVSISVMVNIPPPPPPTVDNDAPPDDSPSDEPLNDSTSDSPVVQTSGDIGLLGPDVAPRAITRTPEMTGTADERLELPVAVNVDAEMSSDESFMDSVRGEADFLAMLHRFATGDDNDTDSPTVREGRIGSVNALNDRAGITIIGQSTQLMQDLDKFQQSLDSDLYLNTVAIGSVGTIVSGFTVGYVLWILRSGLLLSSLLASMPAWTMFDPLLILPGGGGQDDGQEESLEQIVENQSTLAASRQREESEMEPAP
ncbi:MAG: cadherin domain-containing protein [Pirellulaceae bacterium]